MFFGVAAKRTNYARRPNRRAREAASAGLLVSLLLSSGPACSTTLRQGGVEVQFGPSLTREAAQVVLQDAVAARDKVSRFLHKPAPRLITVRIGNLHDGIPYSDGATIDVPESRIGWPRVAHDGRARDTLSIVHETTHVIDSGTRANRFLTEGLAVYVQAAIGGESYPNEGVDLHVCTRELQDGYRTPIAIIDSETVRESAESGLGRQLAYAQEGSFARWLIETQGLTKFQRVLDSETPGRIYGATFNELESMWRAMLLNKHVSEARSCTLKE